MARSPYRDTIVGGFDQDRLWVIHTPEFSAGILDYNDELMGFDPRFAEIDPDVFHYGGNAYYITGVYAQRKGWRVESVEDRR